MQSANMIVWRFVLNYAFMEKRLMKKPDRQKKHDCLEHLENTDISIDIKNFFQ